MPDYGHELVLGTFIAPTAQDPDRVVQLAELTEAASLDLLSGGRFELGLGAGAFPKAVHGMGGPGLTPAQGVKALNEAISIVRGVWDTRQPGPCATTVSSTRCLL
ncbi:LLM class flavin-dependent oxidoreductase [Streptomyces sp. NPDC052721]|uniref:LLM class flavin-dependent oxidoreductase n=1 Tax=Streptomyces sp. NPDC052721 TaxID=3154955 RepID=UPI003434CEFA